MLAKTPLLPGCPLTICTFSHKWAKPREHRIVSVRGRRGALDVPITLQGLRGDKAWGWWCPYLVVNKQEALGNGQEGLSRSRLHRLSHPDPGQQSEHTPSPHCHCVSGGRGPGTQTCSVMMGTNPCVPSTMGSWCSLQVTTVTMTGVG